MIGKALPAFCRIIESTVFESQGVNLVLSDTVAVSLGALGIYLLERGITVESIGDAYWWAIVTVTTVGYGDVSPKTTEGRLVATALMIVGIGVISVFTATLASFFLSSDEQTETARLERRLENIEAKLDAILKERR
jgi:voltage-gated potassium channel